MSNKDPFASLAIKFLLSVFIGFSMILMGILFLFIGLLYQTDGTSKALDWYIGAFVFEVIGIWLFNTTLKSAPEPGKISPSGKMKDSFY
ncbi:MAG: hypothetical protein ACXAB7_19430 [Candidatus Kariarchaeaceae archaeon]|jgi:uncharacterized membrane protein